MDKTIEELKKDFINTWCQDSGIYIERLNGDFNAVIQSAVSAERERCAKQSMWALKELLWFSINRYIMVNSCQRFDGAEKAKRHLEISKILTRFIYCNKHFDNEGDITIKIHDYLSEILTSKMDEVIGYPIETPAYDNELYSNRFFDVIKKNFNKIEEISKQ